MTRVIDVRGSSAATPTACVIFSHGLGDTGHGWAQGFEELADTLPHVKFVFPTARQIPVTLNGGMHMPAWYDIKNLGARMKDEAEGIESSAAFIQALVVREASLVGGADRVIVGGFSQGGALSIVAAHTFPEKLGGILALSSYVTARSHLTQHIEPTNFAAPFLMAHGDADPMIPLAVARESFEFLRGIRRNSTDVMKTYRGMEHSSCPQEMRDVLEFVASHLPSKSKL